MSVKCTKAEKIARFFDKHAGWGDLRQYDMQKTAAMLLRKYETLLRKSFYSELNATEAGEVADLLNSVEESND